MHSTTPRFPPAPWSLVFSSVIFVCFLSVCLSVGRYREQVTDSEGAADLVNAHAGGISFHDVHFGYVPERAILKGLTFEASGVYRLRFFFCFCFSAFCFSLSRVTCLCFYGALAGCLVLILGLAGVDTGEVFPRPCVFSVLLVALVVLGSSSSSSRVKGVMSVNCSKPLEERVLRCQCC